MTSWWPPRAVLSGALLLAFACSTPRSEPAGESATAVAPVPSPRPPPPASASAAPAGKPAPDWSREIVSTRLAVEVGRERARATIEVAAGPAANASFEIGDLAIDGVTGGSGSPLPWVDRGDELDVAIPPGPAATLVVAYRFKPRDGLEGAVRRGHTFTWPYFCGNLFPCRARSTPADGVTFALELSDVPSGFDAVYPRTIATEAPAYMLAWAVGQYRYRDLGKTEAGTEVGVYYASAEEDAATQGTRFLRGAFEWLERTLGPYRFGGKVASVSVPFPAGTFGGMEHHPYWHIAGFAFDNPEVHVHEAAHGWFGNGVRIACWGDFVLSEGTTTYLTGRALEAAGADHALYWRHQESRLGKLPSTVPWPAECSLDVMKLADETPYVKGALFLRAVEERVGRAAFDAALRDFYAARVGGAARFQDLLDHLRKATGYDPSACAEAWLRHAGAPAARACPR